MEFCDTLWLQRVIPFLLPAHITHIKQPLSVSIFVPLTGTYQQLVSATAKHVDSIDTAQFGTLYAQAQERVLTPSAACKAFVNCGITLSSSLAKVLVKLAGCLTGEEEVLASQRQPLHKNPVLRSDVALNATIDAHCQETKLQEAWRLKCAILQAHKEAQASIMVLQAENDLLCHLQDCSKNTAHKVGQKATNGDQPMLSTDVMILQGHTEKELVAKGPAKGSRSRARAQEEEEEEEEEDNVLPPPAAVSDGNKASDGGNKALLSLSALLPPPVMPVGSGNLVTGRCGSDVEAKGVYQAVCLVCCLRWV